jgi:SAM-dependent methyltransferase
VKASSTLDHGKVSDSWEQGDPYEHYVGRWSRAVAPIFLSWLDIPAGQGWLDVGCGTGALIEAIMDQCSPASLVGVEPSPEFLEVARQNLGGRASFHIGSASSIPLADASIDAVVSALVLNFVPDPVAALSEMSRVAVPGATIAAYVWDYAEKMELMRFFWDAAVDLEPEAAKSDEGRRFPLCHPEPLVKLFTLAGLQRVEVESLEIQTPFANFNDFWSPFLGGQGPAPSYALSLTEESRNRLRDRIKERLPIAADGSILLTARAWGVRGSVAN